MPIFSLLVLLTGKLDFNNIFNTHFIYSLLMDSLTMGKRLGMDCSSSSNVLPLLFVLQVGITWVHMMEYAMPRTYQTVFLLWDYECIVELYGCQRNIRLVGCPYSLRIYDENRKLLESFEFKKNLLSTFTSCKLQNNYRLSRTRLHGCIHLKRLEFSIPLSQTCSLLISHTEWSSVCVIIMLKVFDHPFNKAFHIFSRSKITLILGTSVL